MRLCGGLMRAENVPPERTRIRYFADICYVGQSHHLEIPLNASDSDPIGLLYRDFLAAHDRVYGYSTASPARIVNLRTVHVSPVDRPHPATECPTGRTAVRRASPIGGFLTAEGPAIAAVYDRAA